ncbi:MAG: ferritin-like domain-containing protein [Planctomycetaceae bacterium]
MNLRQFAELVLFSDDLAEKLRRPEGELTDDDPGPAVRVEKPARPANLQFAPRRSAPAMPRPQAFDQPQKRGVAHHIMANHELQALEVMAFVMLAFPEAPAEFRIGLAEVMQDEQRHTRLHIERGADLGVPFGSLPVNSYFWTKGLEFTGVLDFVAGLSLTFEGRNLDHTLEFEEYFRNVGDRRSAAVMRIIHRDEIRHVAFGWEWLKRLKPSELTEWETYRAHLHWPLKPEKGIGENFQKRPRLQAGMTEEFLQKLLEEAGSEDGEIGG